MHIVNKLLAVNTMHDAYEFRFFDIHKRMKIEIHLRVERQQLM